MLLNFVKKPVINDYLYDVSTFQWELIKFEIVLLQLRIVCTSNMAAVTCRQNDVIVAA